MNLQTESHSLRSVCKRQRSLITQCLLWIYMRWRRKSRELSIKIKCARLPPEIQFVLSAVICVSPPRRIFYRFVRGAVIAIDGSYKKWKNHTGKKCKELSSSQNFQNHFPNVSNIDVKKRPITEIKIAYIDFCKLATVCNLERKTHNLCFSFI